ncbi:hypothetical protein [Sphingomonas sp.]|jgi:ABC-type phosphate transport system permease subunit|uniref:hypothetical protein n=1 Tax=Sphingomonas sp. TaxID=28214 RepID=UPI002E32A8F1|nr:hypothetical protein [Sphingomonas sp.]HEX4693302.1 hypothetical protein [Sphingomonas sp.]
MAGEEESPQWLGTSNDMLPREHKQHFQRVLTQQAIRSYLFLCLGIGLVALALPVALVAVGGYDGHYSISYFYHVGETTRNILVGALWATGVFLLLYHGLSTLENWLLNIAGVAAISVAMNPMDAQQCSKGLSIHGVSAGLFFVCLAVVAVLLSKGRVKYVKDQAKRRWFKRAYTIAGGAMVAMPAIVWALHQLGGGKCETHWIFWIECLGIWAFAAYWFVKTYEYRVLLGAR